MYLNLETMSTQFCRLYLFLIFAIAASTLLSVDDVRMVYCLNA